MSGCAKFEKLEDPVVKAFRKCSYLVCKLFSAEDNAPHAATWPVDAVVVLETLEQAFDTLSHLIALNAVHARPVYGVEVEAGVRQVCGVAARWARELAEAAVDDALRNLRVITPVNLCPSVEGYLRAALGTGKLHPVPLRFTPGVLLREHRVRSLALCS